MEQVIDFGFDVSGAKMDDIVDGPSLATEAWGDAAEEESSGLTAFAYLWRRFGPPWFGGDPHKDLVSYILTTNDPDVFLVMNLGGIGLARSVSYLAKNELREEYHAPWMAWCRRLDQWQWEQHPELHSLEDTEENREKSGMVLLSERLDASFRDRAIAAIGKAPERKSPEDWRQDDGIMRRVNQALFDALKELERPVYIRDCAINIFGRCDDADNPAEESAYAGYGIPKEALDQFIAEQKG